MLKRRLLPTLLGLLLVVALALLRLGDPAPLSAIRDMGFDAYQHLQPRAGEDSPVRVVDIDDASLARLGQWPWPRATLATLTSRLTELGAASIGYDVLFPEPDRLGPDNDTVFAQALSAGNVALGFSVSPNAPRLTLPPKSGIAISGSDPAGSLPPITGAVAPIPQLAEAAKGLGGLSLSAEDSAGTVRRVPMLWSDGTTLFPGLSVEALRLALGVQTLVALGDTTDGHTLESLRIGQFTVPTSANGEVVFYDKPQDPAQVISAWAVLDDGYRSLREQVAGRIILVGTSASGLLDLHGTPLSASRAGVLIHAGVIDQIVSGQFLSRADWVQALEILLFVVGGMLLVFVVLRLGPLAGLAVAVTLIGAMIAASYAAFALRGWLIDATFPATAALLVYGAMVYFQFSFAERNRLQLRRAFGYYVAPELLTRIEASANQLKLGGEAREITVMFSDMRGFTAFTETHAPSETLSMLNTLFGALGKEIVDRHGTIDKFIGDAILVFFGDPETEGDRNDALRCARMALRMRDRMLELDKVWQENGISKPLRARSRDAPSEASVTPASINDPRPNSLIAHRPFGRRGGSSSRKSCRANLPRTCREPPRGLGRRARRGPKGV